MAERRFDWLVRVEVSADDAPYASRSVELRGSMFAPKEDDPTMFGVEAAKRVLEAAALQAGESGRSEDDG